jgi:hypothetical protein
MFAKVRNYKFKKPENTLGVYGVKPARKKKEQSKSTSQSLVPQKSTSVNTAMRKVEYKPNTKSVPVEAVLHTNEVVLNVPVAKELYKHLKSDKKELSKSLKDKLMFLYHHTPK